MSKPVTVTVYVIQEQGKWGVWENTGHSFFSEETANRHCDKLTAEKLLERLETDELVGLFNKFKQSERGAEFAKLTNKEAQIKALVELEAVSKGALHHGAEDIAGKDSGFYSYECIEVCDA